MATRWALRTFHKEGVRIKGKSSIKYVQFYFSNKARNVFQTLRENKAPHRGYLQMKYLFYIYLHFCHNYPSSSRIYCIPENKREEIFVFNAIWYR